MMLARIHRCILILDVAHSIGVQNGFLLFSVYRNRFLMFVSFFCFETRGIRLPC